MNVLKSHTFFLQLVDHQPPRSHSFHVRNNDDRAPAPIRATRNAGRAPHLIPTPTRHTLLPIPWAPTSPKVRTLSFHTRQRSPSSLTTWPTSMASELHLLQRRRCTGTTSLPPFLSPERNVQCQLGCAVHLTCHPTGVTHMVCPRAQYTSTNCLLGFIALTMPPSRSIGARP